LNNKANDKVTTIEGWNSKLEKNLKKISAEVKESVSDDQMNLDTEQVLIEFLKGSWGGLNNFR